MALQQYIITPWRHIISPHYNNTLTRYIDTSFRYNDWWSLHNDSMFVLCSRTLYSSKLNRMARKCSHSIGWRAVWTMKNSPLQQMWVLDRLHTTIFSTISLPLFPRYKHISFIPWSCFKMSMCSVSSYSLDTSTCPCANSHLSQHLHFTCTYRQVLLTPKNNM